MIRTRVALAAAVAALALAAPVPALATHSATGAAAANITAADVNVIATTAPGEDPFVVTTDDMIWQ
ncbi:hypothetical protein [Streptomyces sp. LMG1-1-1.1]|uniref:hypothetical protein n=1 Tax=Streptomyces sp. LMG1-1-1.1 TaxID=3135245 RepID=UPI0034670DF3